MLFKKLYCICICANIVVTFTILTAAVGITTLATYVVIPVAATTIAGAAGAAGATGEADAAGKVCAAGAAG